MFGKTRFPIVVAAAGLLALSLTACGQIKAGAAATFSHDRISQAQLDDTVIDWRKQWSALGGTDAQAALNLQQQLSKDPSDAPRNALSQLVDFRIWNKAADQADLRVTAGAVQRYSGDLSAALAQAVTGLPSGTALTDLTLAYGLPQSYTQSVARVNYIRATLQQQAISDLEAAGKITNQTDETTGTTLVQNAMLKIYATAADALKVDVNPQYGAFDATKGGLDATVSTSLSKSDPALNGAP